MKVMVTGVAGLLGSFLAEKFIESGNQVVGVDSLIGGYADNVPPGVLFKKADTANFELMLELMDDIDVVFHAACTAYEGLSIFSPSIVTANTFGNSIPLFTAAIAKRVKKIVFCSSMARYGTQEQTPFSEDMQPKPQDPYGIAKLACEDTLRELCTTHGIEYSIAVPHNIIGPRQKYDDPYRNVASIMVNLMLQGRQPIIYGDGNQIRCFSFVGDVIEPLFKMSSEDCVSGEVINVGPDENPITILALAELIASRMNFNLDPVFLPDRPREVKMATCSANKARNLLQYETRTTLEEGVDSIIDYVQKRGVSPFSYHLPIEINNNLTPESWTRKLF